MVLGSKQNYWKERSIHREIERGAMFQVIFVLLKIFPKP